MGNWKYYSSFLAVQVVLFLIRMKAKGRSEGETASFLHLLATCVFVGLPAGEETVLWAPTSQSLSHVLAMRRRFEPA